MRDVPHQKSGETGPIKNQGEPTRSTIRYVLFYAF
jgi:hypothetical protein